MSGGWTRKPLGNGGFFSWNIPGHHSTKQCGHTSTTGWENCGCGPGKPRSTRINVRSGLNSHYFHIIGDGHQPIVGVYIPIIRIPIKSGRFPIPPKKRDNLDHGSSEGPWLGPALGTQSPGPWRHPIITLPKTNSEFTPENRPGPKRKRN